VKTVTEQIAAAGGKVVGTADWWGKRRFAYEINKKHEGYYVVFNLVAPGGALDDMERSMRLADDVVRHKLIRLPDREAARRGLVEAGSAA
jgi:small subunit ribosomal protein S6